MGLQLADWHDVLQVLHETYWIWSPGLNQADYRHYVSAQMNHPWLRRHMRYFVYKVADQVVASCKLYDVTMSARGRLYKVGGIGAVYTQKEFRGHGHAKAMLHDLIDLTDGEGYDGLILYSEIDPAFYERFGFLELGGADFNILLPPSSSESEQRSSSPIRLEEVTSMVRHQTRWLRTQPYGIVRDEDYWHYKLMRERYLNKHSRLSWPELQITHDPDNSGYMISEYGGGTLRVLEIIGGLSARTKLWETLFHDACARGVRRIRGWEAGIRDLAPCYSVNTLVSDGMFNGRIPPVECQVRSWGLPMLLPFNHDLDDWPTAAPCPLLELDHF